MSAMMYFEQIDVVLLAVPRTGSTSLHWMLGQYADFSFVSPPQEKHITARHFTRTYGRFLKPQNSLKHELVAVMREPLSWLGSWYRYRQRPELSGTKKSTINVSFDDFVKASLSDAPPNYARLGSQYRFLSDKNGIVLATRVFDFAKFEEVLEYFERRLAAKFNNVVLNSSTPLDLTLSKCTEQKYRERHSEDFLLYESVKAAENGLLTEKVLASAY